MMYSTVHTVAVIINSLTSKMFLCMYIEYYVCACNDNIKGSTTLNVLRVFYGHVNYKQTNIPVMSNNNVYIILPRRNVNFV